MPYAQYDSRHGIAFMRINGRQVVWPSFTAANNDVFPIDVETSLGLESFTAGPGGGHRYSQRFEIFQAPSPDGQFMFSSSSSYNGSLN